MTISVQPYIPSTMNAGSNGHTTALAALTAREREVLRRTSLGETNAQIAADLGVTVHAVKFHLSSIFRKLGVPNRTTAAAWYMARAGEAAN